MFLNCNISDTNKLQHSSTFYLEKLRHFFLRRFAISLHVIFRNAQLKLVHDVTANNINYALMSQHDE